MRCSGGKNSQMKSKTTFAVSRLAASAAGGLLALILPIVASATSPLSIVSDNSMGAVEWTNSVALNTDTSQICGFSNTGVELCGSDFVPSTLVQQADGSRVRVFNFTSLTLDEGIGLTLQGSLPAAIVASGDIVINGTVVVNSGAHAGGLSQASAPGVTGGRVGYGNGRYVSNCCAAGYDTSSGGGGGGKASAGQKGDPGVIFFTGADNGAGGPGGAADSHPRILSGGGGGGGGQWGTGYDFFQDGGAGGGGGGAALFETPGNMTIGATGVIEANGANGQEANRGPAAAGGGGAGGALWFDAGLAWINRGVISASGGHGASGRIYKPFLTYYGDGGSGSGGEIFVDPQSITNLGLIDVADGNGGGTLGGHVTLLAPTIVNEGSIVGVAPSSAPEPSTWALIVAGLALLAGPLRRRGHKLAAASRSWA